MTGESVAGAHSGRRAAGPNVVARVAGALAARGTIAILAGLGLVVAGSTLVEIGRLNTWDEAWFLQVATRVSEGDALYRDVFFGTTPLAAYIGAELVTLFGPELVVLKLAGVACIAATYLAVVSIARQLQLPIGPVVWAAAVFVVEVPYTFGYSILAVTLLLAAFSALLAWNQRAASGRPGAWRWLMLAGVLAGASLAAKHNTGALGALALLGSSLVLLRERGGLRLRDATVTTAMLTGPMAGVVLLAAAPIALSGATTAAFDYGVASKVTYVGLGALSYEIGIQHSLGALLANAGPSIRTLLAGFQSGRPFVFLLPPLTAVVALLAWRWRPNVLRGPGLALLLLSAAAAASIYPRADQSHLTVIAPIFLVSLAFFARGVLARSAAMIVALACVCLAALLLVSAPLMWLRAGSVMATTPHLRGLVLSPGHERQLVALADELRANVGDAPTLYLFPEAGLYYLLTNLSNSTPFDFPLRTAFGTDGLRATIDRIDRGEIQQVCLHPTWGRPGSLPGPFPELQPIELGRYVRERMTPVASLGVCDLFRSRGTSAAH